MIGEEVKTEEVVLSYTPNPEDVHTFNLFGVIVDVRMLREQKAELTAAIMNEQLSPQMNGLVRFLDALQDQMAYITSEEFVFGKLEDD